MTKQRYDVTYEKEPRGQVVTDNGIPCTARTCCTRLNWLEEENKELKDLLKSMADRNNEIWLDNGQIIRLEKVFKGEWTND